MFGGGFVVGLGGGDFLFGVDLFFVWGGFLFGGVGKLRGGLERGVLTSCGRSSPVPQDNSVSLDPPHAASTKITRRSRHCWTVFAPWFSSVGCQTGALVSLVSLLAISCFWD